MSVTDEGTAIRSRTRAGLARLAGPWWIFLLTGIAWLILSWIALRFAPASIPTVGILLGFLFLAAMVNEFFIASVVPGWRWLHVLMGIIFAFGAGWSFVQPYNAFWALASILGLLLVFRGTFYIITSVSTREVNSVWWLGRSCSVLGLPAVPPGSRRAAADLGRLLRPVPRHLGDRDRLRAPPGPARLAGLSAASTAVPPLTHQLHPPCGHRSGPEGGLRRGPGRHDPGWRSVIITNGALGIMKQSGL